jgi:hypothetical protein
MATYDVVAVRRENAKSGPHRHIIGVCTSTGIYATNQQVVDSIRDGNVWQTSVPGEPKATIKSANTCWTGAGCPIYPYLTTLPDHSTKNNLEQLSDC